MSEINIESYPPIFRSSSSSNNSTQKLDQIHGQVERAGSSDPLPLPLPIIDMECLDVGELNKACREWGLFRLENHGVPTSLLSQLQEHAKRLFQLPFEAKQGLSSSPNCPINYFWGTPALNSSGSALQRPNHALINKDWIEGLNFPTSQLHHHHHHIQYDPLINDFRNLLKEYTRHLNGIASTIFEAMVRNLKLDLDTIEPFLDESTGSIRVYRYPRRSMVDHVQGLHEHTDSSVVSILNEDEVGGLQFFKDDQWFKVVPDPSTLVLNLGDMMQALSDDEYKSVKHKVELNSKEDKERVSICYFVFPEDNTLINKHNNSSLYKPFSYSAFRAQVQQDLITHGSKIGLPNFKLHQ